MNQTKCTGNKPDTGNTIIANPLNDPDKGWNTPSDLSGFENLTGLGKGVEREA